MKFAAMFAFFALIQTTAFAGTGGYRLVCSTPNAKGASYFEAALLVKAPGADGSYAKIRFPNSKNLLTMKCVSPAIEPGRGFADQMVPVAFCDDGGRDGGFSLQVQAGGFAGITTATLVEKNFVQNRAIARMVCQSPNRAPKI